MLDKSLPYYGLYMRREAGAKAPPASLPSGFKFVLWGDGDESCWARIETSVLEFDNEFAALVHFNKHFMPYADELRLRCLFIEDCDGLKIGTATAWWSYVNEQRRPWLHWVAVDPRYQGLGLGKAFVAEVTSLMIKLEGDVDFFLHTQTWSYKAVSIYKGHGYQPTNERALYSNRKNNYKKAIKLIKKLESDRNTPARRV